MVEMSSFSDDDRYEAELRRTGRLIGQLATPEETADLRRRSHRVRYELPQTWNIGHVDHRLVEAFKVLLRLPVRVWPKEFGSGMPAYIHEWSDYVAQSEGERELKRARNRLIYRNRGASADEVRLMDQALGWPLACLSHDADASRAVLLAALWKALEVDFDERLGRINVPRRTFFRWRKAGLDRIVAHLTRERYPVE